MSNNKDILSALIYRFIEVLLVKEPYRTTIGSLLGFTFVVLHTLFLPTLRAINHVDFEAVPVWWWIPVGILITHIPILLSMLFNKSHQDKDLDRALAAIINSNLSPDEKKKQHIELIQSYIADIDFNKKTKDKSISKS